MPLYSPSLGCDAFLDGWCDSQCAKPFPLRARQPSASSGGALFFCYSQATLSRLERVTSNLTRDPPMLCGRKSTAYVKSMHMTPEQLGLLMTLQACLHNRSKVRMEEAGGAEKKGLQQPSYYAARRAALAALQQPMIRTSAEPSAPRGIHEASSAWRASRLNRSPDRASSAARCVSEGRGAWRSLTHSSSSSTTTVVGSAISPIATTYSSSSSFGSGHGQQHEEPYLVSTDVLPRANQSKWWWGACDDDLRRGLVRVPRSAVLQSWEPQGEGCDALRKGRRRLPGLRVLAHAFCAKHAGKSVLFVGDSVQGQFFISFIMALGVWSSEPQMGRGRGWPAAGAEGASAAGRGAPPSCAKDARYLASLATVHEFNMDVTLCGSGAAAVRARFIRNELLWLDRHAPSGDETSSEAAHTATESRISSSSTTTAAARDDSTTALTAASAPTPRAPAPRGSESVTESAEVPGSPAPSAPHTPSVSPSPPHVPRNFVMCDWRAAAVQSDLLVLNRGMHFSPDAIVQLQLEATFRRIRSSRPLPAGGAGAAGVVTAGGGAASAAGRSRFDEGPEESLRVVYRGTHAPIPSCHVLDDPLPVPFPYAYAAEHDPVMRSYHWAEFDRQNALAARLARLHNFTFLDVHYATSLRPGGHMPSRKAAAGDCAHYCLPGPIDEWTKLLLALWT